jgi:hypothetical protein
MYQRARHCAGWASSDVVACELAAGQGGRASGGFGGWACHEYGRLDRVAAVTDSGRRTRHGCGKGAALRGCVERCRAVRLSIAAFGRLEGRAALPCPQCGMKERMRLVGNVYFSMS